MLLEGPVVWRLLEGVQVFHKGVDVDEQLLVILLGLLLVSGDCTFILLVFLAPFVFLFLLFF